MWRIYSYHKDGVKVQTTARKLINSLFSAIPVEPEKKAFLGKVDYLTTGEIIQKMEDESWVHNTMFDPTHRAKAETLLFKRIEFSHENEVRLIYYEAQRYEVGQYPKYFEFQFNPAELIDEIELDPRLTSLEYLQIEKQLLRAGYSNKMSKSTLYETPVIYSRINAGEMSLKEAQILAMRSLKKSNINGK